VRVSAQLASGESAAAEGAFTVVPSPLCAAIAGGRRVISRDEPALALDASGSHDPDACPPRELAHNGAPCADPGLAFAWACALPDGSPCRLRATGAPLALPAAAQVAVDLSALALDAEATWPPLPPPILPYVSCFVHTN